jgi:enamine deaminase RidA (YjgF/YER057c/UK114 family)
VIYRFLDMWKFFRNIEKVLDKEGLENSWVWAMGDEKFLQDQARKVPENFGEKTWGNFFFFRHRFNLNLGNSVGIKFFSGENGGEVLEGKNWGEIFRSMSENFFVPIGLETVIKFWNFLPDVKKGYSDLNRERDKFFKKNGVKKFPAATGIEADIGKINAQGTLEFRGNNFCFFEKFAGKNFEKKFLDHPFQKTPAQYGPKFSRGIFLQKLDENRKQIFVSGISSIDESGDSVYVDDPVKNVNYVIESVRVMLTTHDFSWADVHESIAYFRSEESVKIFQEFLSNQEKWGMKIPVQFYATNICRENLFFEWEVQALK